MENKEFKCSKCGSLDIVDVDELLMCNACGEILNQDAKKERSIKVDAILEEKEVNVGHIKVNSKDLGKITIKDKELEKEHIKESYIDNQENQDSFDVMDNEDLWCYIDDEEGLDEELDVLDGNSEYEEVFPGLITFRKKDN
ncbi:hypothetical protein [Hathewaya limosa]|uniref:Zn finger protein n=1 Tax=Hathewaya limosa TaxID=1536 RepID=A0ABU0JP16_HATLI|nr:hypothetical protein [Hathewaya limosa]AWZ48587.1 hypothetical protein C3495_07035 [Clostridiaceae bacterium 14S0207]MDQ0478831.1 putative Zn finger protein [Hathewaya limosa]